MYFKMMAGGEKSAGKEEGYSKGRKGLSGVDGKKVCGKEKKSG